MIKLKDLLPEGKLTEAGVNVWYFYKKANKDKKKFFKMLSDFRKKHSDTKWIKMLNYALKDFNENPKKYKTIDDKQNILFKNLQNNKKVYEGKLTEGKWGAKGKYLTMPDGEISSIPGDRDRDSIVFSIGQSTFRLNSFAGGKKMSIVGDYQKDFKNVNDLVKWLNKNKAKYLGID